MNFLIWPSKENDSPEFSFQINLNLLASLRLTVNFPMTKLSFSHFAKPTWNDALRLLLRRSVFISIRKSSIERN